MRTISIYSRQYINVESDGIIYACQIYGEDRIRHIFSLMALGMS